MAKGYQAYRDSWATFLSKEMPCLRKVGNWVNFSLTFKGVVNCHVLLTRK